MRKKVFIDAGHGGIDPGAVGNGMNEAYINFNVALMLGQILEKDFDIMLSRPTLDANIGANGRFAFDRAGMANNWGADLLLSVHCNAFSQESANGYETFFAATKPQDRNAATIIHNIFVTETGLRDRGVKLDGQSQHSGGLGILRNARMTAVLVELAFITANPNSLDVTFLRDKRQEMASILAKGVYAYFGMEMVAELPSKEVPQVTPPTINNNEGARELRFNTVAEVPEWARPTIEKLVAYCDYKNMPKGILRGNNGDGTGLDLSMDMIRILVLLDREGLFSMPANLVPPLATLPKIPPPSPIISKNHIMGKSTLTAEQLTAFLLSREPNPQIYCTPLELAQYFIEEGNKVGVRGDIAFMQSIHETGWFRFGGQVLPEQNNFAGFGAIDGTTIGQGNNFGSPEVGVRAQIHHLFAYATTEPLPEGIENASPRAHFVQRGSAPNWEDLNGLWAVPGVGYGEGIIAMFNIAIQFSEKQ